jgi:cbb3-type cytochrome oxidase subunit 1
MSTSIAPASPFTVRLHAWCALAFLVGGAALLLAAYAGLAWPAWLEGTSFAEYLTYGRVMPAAVNALLFGWITLGLLGALYYFVPRLVSGPLAMAGAAALSAVVITIGVASGVVAILAGEGTGGRFLEMPWYSDVILLAGFLVAAVVISATVSRADGERFGVPVWYSLAAPWWLFLAYATGAIPGFTGVDAELQSAFSSTAVFGMWAVSAAIGLGYALVAEQVPDAEFHPRLGRIGFWSLGLLWAWTAARTLQYGPTADWMETIPVLFGAGLVVASIAVVTDFAFAVRGRFSAVTASTSLSLYAVGTGLFLLVPGHIVVQSLRSSSAVLRFTAWEAAFDLLAITGAFTFWTAALVGHVFSPAARRRLGGTAGRWAMLLGVLFAIGTRWIAGLQQGYTWLGGVESGLYENSGEGFSNTVEILHGTDVLTFIGLAVFAIGALLFAIGIGLPLAEERDDAHGPIWLFAVGLAGVVIGTLLPVGGTALIAGVSGVAAVAGLVWYLVGPRIERRSRGEAVPDSDTDDDTSSGERRIAGALIGFGLLALIAGTALPIDGTILASFGGLAAVGAGFVVLGAARDRSRGTPRSIEFEWPDTERVGTIRRGAIAVFALALFAVFVLPAVDSSNEPTLLADTSRHLDDDPVAARGQEVYVAEGCWYCHTQQVRAVVTDLGLGPVSVVGDYVYDPAGTLGVARIGPDLAHAGSRDLTGDPVWVAEHLADPRAARPWSTMPAYAHLDADDLNALGVYVAGLE